MNEFIDKVMERPLSHRIGFWVLSLALLTFIFWQYFYSSKSEELGKLREKVDTLQTQISQEQRLARNLPKVREEVKELDVKLKFALQELPDAREIPDLLSSISDLAMDSGLEVSLFKPKSENFKDFYAEVPVSVSVEGTFHQVVTFFDEVGHLPRIVNINSITVRDPKVTESEVKVVVDCLATTFRYLEEEERVKRQQSDKKKRRR